MLTPCSSNDAEDVAELAAMEQEVLASQMPAPEMATGSPRRAVCEPRFYGRSVVPHRTVVRSSYVVIRKYGHRRFRKCRSALGASKNLKCKIVHLDCISNDKFEFSKISFTRRFLSPCIRCDVALRTEGRGLPGTARREAPRHQCDMFSLRKWSENMPIPIIGDRECLLLRSSSASQQF